MKLLVTTNGRLFRTPDGIFYTPIVYDYVFFQRYLEIFDSVRLVAHVTEVEKAAPDWLRVDGHKLEIFPVISPKGKIGYLKNYKAIRQSLKIAIIDCDAANLRIPDELAFQLYRIIRQYSKIPVGIEVTSNSWDFFSPGATKGFLRPILRRWWDFQQKRLCKEADASCYVTKEAIQKRYTSGIDKYTTYCSDVDIEQYCDDPHREYGDKPITELRILHISGSISGKAKGHKELVEALAMLKTKGYKFHCTLIGKGNLDSDILEIVNVNDLDITFAGTKKAIEIRELLLNHDMFVFPSYREGLPRVIVEAMASGIMIVATALDGIKELLPIESLVEVRSSEQLSAKIEHYLKNPMEMTKISMINKSSSEDYRKVSLNRRRSDYYGTLRNLAYEIKK